MTEAELTAIAARAQAATPGPWNYWFRPRGTTVGPHANQVTAVVRYSYGSGNVDADAAFIAAARADVPALVAEVRRLRAELAVYTAPLRKPTDDTPVGTLLGYVQFVYDGRPAPMIYPLEEEETDE